MPESSYKEKIITAVSWRGHIAPPETRTRGSLGITGAKYGAAASLKYPQEKTKPANLHICSTKKSFQNEGKFRSLKDKLKSWSPADLCSVHREGRQDAGGISSTELHRPARARFIREGRPHPGLRGLPVPGIAWGPPAHWAHTCFWKIPLSKRSHWRWEGFCDARHSEHGNLLFK